MVRKGVTTSFTLDGEALKSAFGDLKPKVATWSQPRSFSKARRTGSETISVISAEGKFSTGTSTLTIKFGLSVSYGGDGGGSDDDNMMGFMF